MEKLKSIENERTKSKESETAELDSDSDDSDSCISIDDSSSEEEAVNNLAERAVQKKTLNRKPVFKKNAKNCPWIPANLSKDHSLLCSYSHMLDQC